MKKLIVYIAVLLCITISCNPSKEVFEKNTFDKNLENYSKQRLGEPSERDSLNHDDMGEFIYALVRRHSLHVDMYSILPAEIQKPFKAKIDSVKKAGIQPSIFYWNKLLDARVISNKCFNALNQFDRNLKNYCNDPSVNVDGLDQWFKNSTIDVKRNTDLSFADKDFIIRHQTVVRYLIKAMIASIPQPVAVKGGRVAVSSCIVTLIQCGVDTISSWSSVGAVIGSAFSASTGTIPGGIVGAVAGFFFSLFSCSCPDAPCLAPNALSTPDVCYNQFNGITFDLAGFGNVDPTQNQGLELFIYSNSTLTNLLVHKLSTSSSINVSDGDLQGNRVIYVRAASNCGSNGGLLYANAAEVFNLDVLGKPSFYVDGNTNPVVNSQVFYNIVGRNLNTVVWNIYTYGPTNGTILSQNPSGVNVQWNNASGFVHLVADATSPCGTSSNGKYITTHN